jgi:hypothetical protein
MKHAVPRKHFGNSIATAFVPDFLKPTLPEVSLVFGHGVVSTVYTTPVVRWISARLPVASAPRHLHLGHPSETLSKFFRYIYIVGRFGFASPNYHQITGRAAKRTLLPSDIDLPPSAVTEIASILARG